MKICLFYSVFYIATLPDLRKTSGLIERTLDHLIWPVVTKMFVCFFFFFFFFFSIPLAKVYIHFDHVRMYVTPYLISWIILALDLEPMYTDKLLEFRWVQPIGTNCAPLAADLFLYCYERNFMDSLNHDNQADVNCQVPR